MPYFEREKKQWLKQFTDEVKGAFEPEKFRMMVNGAETIRDAEGERVRFANQEDFQAALKSLDAQDGRYTMDARVGHGLHRGGYLPAEISSMLPSQKVRYASACSNASGRLEVMNLKYSEHRGRIGDDEDVLRALTRDQQEFVTTLYQAGKDVFSAQAKIQATKDARAQMSDARGQASEGSQESEKAESAPWQRYMGRFR